MTEEKETKTEKPKKPKRNTMKISVINSRGTEVKAAGVCTDSECKRVIRALFHTPDQDFEIKNHG